MSNSVKFLQCLGLIIGICLINSCGDEEKKPATFTASLGDTETFSEMLRHSFVVLDNGEYVTAFNAFSPLEHTDNGNTVDDIGIHLAKLDTEGKLIWDRYLQTDKISRCSEMIQARDGGLLIVGTQSASTEVYDNLSPYLIKTDQDGMLLWEKVYHVGASASGYEIIEHPSGELSILAGGGGSPSLLELDAEGNLLNSSPQVGVRTIALSQSGGMILAGSIFKLLEDNEESWTYTFTEPGSTTTYVLNDVMESLDGGFVGYGYHSIGPSPEEVDFFMIKIDAEGQPLWQKTFSEPGDNVGTDIALTPQGNYLTLGMNYQPDGSTVLRVRTLDPEGEELSLNLIDFDFAVSSIASDIAQIDERYAIVLGLGRTSSGTLRQVLSKVDLRE